MDDILPMSNRRKPRVWTYWNDIFHRHVPDWFRGLLFDRISRSTDYHIICTKRPEEAVRYLTKAHWNIALDNVIILVTTENQARLDQRRDATLHLHRMDWRVGILAEPLLAPLDLSRLAFIPAWIICGPENGPGKRAFNASWAGSLQYQAKNMGVPFFYKANGGILGGAGPFLECPG
jgi:protein gp37